MPDERNKNQGQQGDLGQGQQGGSQTPGRHPQEDKSAGGRDRGDQGGQEGRQQGGGSKEGGQNEETRR